MAKDFTSISVETDTQRKLRRIAEKERRSVPQSIAFYADSRYFELFGTDELPEEENTSAVPSAELAEVEDN